MAAMSDYLEQNVLEYLLRGGSLSQPTEIYVALFTDDPTDSNETSNELSDNGYSRQDAADGGSVEEGWTSPSEDGDGYSCENELELEFPPIEDGTVTVTHFGLYDASSGGNLLFHGEFDTSRDLAVDDVVAISAGALTVRVE